MQKEKGTQVHLKSYQQNVFTNYTYLIYMYEQVLALHNQQGLISY